MKVLILGGTGMLGHKLVQVLSADPRVDVHYTVRDAAGNPSFHGATGHAGVDVAGDMGALRRVLADQGPDVVINAIGVIKQIKMDGQPEKAFLVNGELPHLIPFYNSNPEARVIQFSTDCVFTGTRGNYTESDRPDVRDVYGRSKACGELDYGAHLTLRTSIVGFELRGHVSLLSWLLSQPPGSRLNGYRRAIFSGLPTCTLARTVRDLILDFPALRGLYHIASQPITKFDLLQRVNDALGLGHTLQPDDSFVIDRSLNDSRLRKETGTVTPGWDALVEELVRDYETMPYRSIYEAMCSK